MDSPIRITKLARTDQGWRANVNGIPVMTLGKSGTMSAWVTAPRRFDRKHHEVAPAVRARLIKQVRREARA